jgi:enoyl-CoA hydratase/carnithine racemase
MNGIKIEKHGHVAVVTISNPPANTWTEASLNLLATQVEALNNDRNVFALVLTGEGEKFFSAGADLNMFASGDKGVASTLAHVFGKAFTALSNFRGVSIAAINGYAMGGGLEAAMACDLRIIEEQAQVALPEAKVGLLPCGLGTQTLTRLVGEPWAKRLILCGERIDASKALEIGLVEEVVEKGAALNKAMALAAQVGDQSPVSVAMSKSLIQATRSTSMVDALYREREAFVELFDYDDTTEGVNAFLEKRKPNWKNG